MVFNWIKSKFTKLHEVLSSTRKEFSIRLKKLFGRYVDEELLEEIEEILYESDLGVSIAKDILAKIRVYMKSHPTAQVEDILGVIEQGLLDEMAHVQHSFTFSAHSHIPTIILVVGTNGNGKTTSCAKLAYMMKHQFGKKVLLGACDTFRAAAQDQLVHWAEKVGVDIVRGRNHGDPAAVAYDAIQAAKARGSDVVILDTAGRLENKANLMKELEKIRRSCEKACSDGSDVKIDSAIPHETLLVMDATTGQNGLEQAKSFHSTAPLTGIILTKLDGSAKGGTAISIQKYLHLPVKCIGVGEKAEDMLFFDSKAFVKAMLFEDKEIS